MAENYEDTTDVGAYIQKHEAAAALALLFRPRDPGDYYLRILPRRLAPGQKGSFDREFGKHYKFDILRGAPGTQPNATVCPHASVQQLCQACQYNENLFRQAYGTDGRTNETILKNAMATSMKVRHICNVLPVTARNEAIGGLGVKMWEFGPSIMKDLRRDFAAYAPVSLTDPQRGYVIRVTYERGQGINAKNAGVHPVQAPIPYPKWAEERHDLDNYVEAQVPTQQQLAEWFAPPTLHAATVQPQPYRPEPQPEPAAGPYNAPQDGTGPSPEPGTTAPADFQSQLKAFASGKLTKDHLDLIASGRLSGPEIAALLAKVS